MGGGGVESVGEGPCDSCDRDRGEESVHDEYPDVKRLHVFPVLSG